MPKVTRRSSGFTQRLLREAPREVTAALFEAGGLIADEAALSITRGSVGGKNHVASKPGEAPNADTGDLDRSIGVRVVEEGVVEVFANAGHAVPLEFGTSKMSERPFMRPAGRKMQPETKKKLAAAAKAIAAGSRLR